ncbi:hypothetical protein FG05_04493 [Fusarium graminearum]|nr:hypothetical protein FG05_04493 [Fusarium graminearum]
MPGSALHPNIQPGHRLKQRPQPDLQHTSHAYDIRHPPQFSSMDGLPFSFTSQPAAAQAFQYPPHLSISGSSRSSRLHSSPSSSSSSTHADSPEHTPGTHLITNDTTVPQVMGSRWYETHRRTSDETTINEKPREKTLRPTRPSRPDYDLISTKVTIWTTPRKLIEIMDRSTRLALVFLSVDRYSEK